MLQVESEGGMVFRCAAPSSYTKTISDKVTIFMQNICEFRTIFQKSIREENMIALNLSGVQ